MPGYPESSDGGPERTREDRKRVEEAIINDLIDEFQDDISEIAENQIGQRQLRKNQFPETHDAAVCGRRSQQEKNHVGEKMYHCRAQTAAVRDLICPAPPLRSPSFFTLLPLSKKCHDGASPGYTSME